MLGFSSADFTSIYAASSLENSVVVLILAESVSYNTKYS